MYLPKITWCDYEENLDFISVNSCTSIWPTTLLPLCVGVERNYEDAVSKLDQTRIEWESRMMDFCKVSIAWLTHIRHLIISHTKRPAYAVCYSSSTRAVVVLDEPERVLYKIGLQSLCTNSHCNTLVHSTMSPTCLAADLSVLVPTVCHCRRLSWQPSPTGLYRLLAHRPGMTCQMTWLPLSRYPPSISDSKLICSPNPFSDYSLDWTSSNLPLVDLAVVCITWATLETLRIDWLIDTRRNILSIESYRREAAAVMLLMLSTPLNVYDLHDMAFKVTLEACCAHSVWCFA